jgi:hypothetical protein
MSNVPSIYFEKRSITLTEFGRIVAVREYKDWVEISNDIGLELRMKKAYHRWPHALAKCRSFMTKNIKTVTRCGAGISNQVFFNEIYIDPPGAQLLAFPPDGKNAPNTVEQLIMERVWKQEVWAEDISNTADLITERDRFHTALQIQSERDKFLTDRTTTFLNQNYSQFLLKQIIYLRVDKRTRRRAAMRLGIDLSGHSNLKVHLEGHLHNTNFIHVTLPEFEGMDGVIGLHRNEDGNQWISTINNGDRNWWKHEAKIANHNKDVDKPITHFLSLFSEIQLSRHGLLKNRRGDTASHLTLIKFPKNRDSL